MTSLPLLPTAMPSGELNNDCSRFPSWNPGVLPPRESVYCPSMAADALIVFVNEQNIAIVDSRLAGPVSIAYRAGRIRSPPWVPSISSASEALLPSQKFCPVQVTTDALLAVSPSMRGQV